MKQANPKLGKLNTILICKVCGCESNYLAWHIRKHGMTGAEYKREYPNSPLRVINWNKQLSEAAKKHPCTLAGWNKGLTKETNASVAKMANNQARNEKIRLANVGRNVTWGANISKGKKGKPCAIAGWNKGLTKENNASMAKMAANPNKSISTTNRLLKSWQDPEYAKRVFKSREAPNKAEKYLADLLEQYYPHEWKFVGGGDVVIAGKIPDFININGHKRIIELYGELWHTEEEAIQRIQTFKDYGYSTLIIWGKELKNVATLLDKVKSFPSIEAIHEPPISKGEERVQSFVKTEAIKC